MKIIEIESKESKKIKDLRKLQLKKYREKENKFVVENLKIIQDALGSGFNFEEIFVTRNFLNKNVDKLEEILKENKTEHLSIISEKLLKNISSLKNPEGIWAIYKKQIRAVNFSESSVYLNGINDPGNLGTIFRSALAFGLENIILDEKCADVYNPKTIQAAKDAIFKLNFCLDKNLEIINKIKEKEVKIYATHVCEGRDIETIFASKENICIIMGSESHGVEKELLEIADGFLNIKTTSKIESLNVAISAGIIFYEFFKSRTKYNKA